MTLQALVALELVHRKRHVLHVFGYSVFNIFESPCHLHKRCLRLIRNLSELITLAIRIFRHRRHDCQLSVDVSLFLKSLNVA